MIDDKDIKKLKEVFATEERIEKIFEENNKKLEERIDKRFEENNKKLVESFSEVFVTKTDFEDFKDEYRKDFSGFLTKLDEKADVESTEVQENAMLKNKVGRHEKWIKQVAQKVDVRLES